MGNLILQIAFGICLIILAGGLVAYMNNRKRPRGTFKGIGPDHAEKIEARLDALEQRLTDIQDVMITIDDKLDRQERRSDVSVGKGNDSPRRES